MNHTLVPVLLVHVLITLAFAQISFTDLDVTLRNELQTAFDNNRRLIGSVTRLIFHDCAGQQEGVVFPVARNSICDGCIDFDNAKHAGLQSLAVQPLDTIYTASTNQWNTRLSRADFWAAAATIAVQYAQQLDGSTDTLPTIPFYLGRRDCSASPDANIVAGSYALPYKPFPNDLGGWEENLRWFQTNFAFDITKTIAIIGTHTLGRLHSQFSGYGTTRGTPWVGGDDELNNNFFRDLVRRPWLQSLNAQGLYEWRVAGNNNRVFLNSDIALFKDIDDELSSDGQVSCAFDSCPDNVQAAALIALYSRNNQEWLNDFAEAFDEMITMGYTVGVNGFGVVDNVPVSGNTPTLPPVAVPPPTTTTTTTSTTSTSAVNAPTRRPRGGRGGGGNP